MHCGELARAWSAPMLSPVPAAEVADDDDDAMVYPMVMVENEMVGGAERRKVCVSWRSADVRSRLVLVVYLHTFTPGLERWQMSHLQRMQEIRSLISCATRVFRQGPSHACAAERLYRMALQRIPHGEPDAVSTGESRTTEQSQTDDELGGMTEEEIVNWRDMRVLCFSNMASCQATMGDRVKAAHAIDEALRWDPGHMKSLYLRATRRFQRGEYELALEDIQRALSASPSDVHFLELQSKVQSASRISEEKQRARLRNAFKNKS
jgi:tetratricopeptide (TPR) repeat protein